MSFQSSPDLVVGRYNVKQNWHVWPVMFQSSPDLVVGRYVCIRPPEASLLSRFNPRPTW